MVARRHLIFLVLAVTGAGCASRAPNVPIVPPPAPATPGPVAQPPASAPPRPAGPPRASRDSGLELPPGARFVTDVVPSLFVAQLPSFAFVPIKPVTVRAHPSQSAPVLARLAPERARDLEHAVHAASWLYVTRRPGMARVLRRLELVVLDYGAVSVLSNGQRGQSGEPPLGDGMVTESLVLSPGDELELLGGDGHAIALRGSVYWVLSCAGDVEETCAWDARWKSPTSSRGSFQLVSPPLVESWLQILPEGWALWDGEAMFTNFQLCGTPG